MPKRHDTLFLFFAFMGLCTCFILAFFVVDWLLMQLARLFA